MCSSYATFIGIATMTKRTFPEEGCPAHGTSFPCVPTQEVDVGSTIAILQQQEVELPPHTEKLRWKPTRPMNTGGTQNHQLQPRSKAAEGTEIRK